MEWNINDVKLDDDFRPLFAYDVIYIMDGKEGAPMGLERGYVVMALERIMWRNPTGKCGGWFPDESWDLREPGAFAKCLEQVQA